MKNIKDYSYSTVDQPELTNNPNILYNGFPNPELKDGRWLPKKKEEYQSLLESLFLATDRCYFIEWEPYKIKEENWDSITFEPTQTGQIITINRNQIDILKTKEFKEDCHISPTLFIPHFWYWEWSDLLHKLEIEQVSIFDKGSKEIILKRYDRMFSKLKQWDYPSDQRWINSLFYLSILLDFDKKKQKNLTKYFINNALNTCYREEEHHYWLGKAYKVQDIRKKIWLSIKQIHDNDDSRKDKHKYISIEDCKKIADRANISLEEFSDILYDVCLFKLWDENKASASFHRKTNFQLEEIKQYLLPKQKEDIENIQYIYKHGNDHHSWIFYNIKRYDLLKANELIWINFSEQKNKIENNKKTSIQIRQERIKELWEAFHNQYKNHILDIDIDKYSEEHKWNIEDGHIYLAKEWDTLLLTDNIQNRDILWSIKMRLGKTRSDHYDHINDTQLCYWAKKYEGDIFSSENISIEQVYSILEIFHSNSNKIELNLYSLKFWK